MAQKSSTSCEGLPAGKAAAIGEGEGRVMRRPSSLKESSVSVHRRGTRDDESPRLLATAVDVADTADAAVEDGAEEEGSASIPKEAEHLTREEQREEVRAGKGVPVDLFVARGEGETRPETDAMAQGGVRKKANDLPISFSL